jgi:cytochrome c oxidase subunit 2
VKTRAAFAILVAVLLLGTAFHFYSQSLPRPANVFAQAFDFSWRLNLLLLGIAFLVTHAALAWFVWNNREHSDSAERQPSWRSELLWAGVALTLFVGLAAASTHTWERVKPLGADRSVKVRVEVVGQQFRWYFRYPGADGKFGRADLKLVDASEGNPLGLDRNDPDAKDDVVATTLTLPAGVPVEFDLHSQDVIHSFFIPELRFKQDAVPGMVIPIHTVFQATGEYEVACAELCGLGHHQMNAKVRVVSPEEFAKWEARR